MGNWEHIRAQRYTSKSCEYSARSLYIQLTSGLGLTYIIFQDNYMTISCGSGLRDGHGSSGRVWTVSSNSSLHVLPTELRRFDHMTVVHVHASM